MRTPAGAARPLTWLRLQIVATVVLALSLLAVMAVFALIVPPLVISAVVSGFTAYALRRWASEKRWIRLVGAALALFIILVNVPFLISDLSHPESPLPFVVNALFVVSALTASIAGAAGFRQASENAARPVALGALAVAAVLVVVSAVAALTLESDAAQAGDVLVLAEKVEYPEAVQAKVGQALFVENRDPFRHTFGIEERGIEVEIPASTDRRIVLDLPAGSYTYICTVIGHEQMEGVLTVTP